MIYSGIQITSVVGLVIKKKHPLNYYSSELNETFRYCFPKTIPYKSFW